MSGYSGALLPQHAEMLAASKITPEHASARGYQSVDERTWFDRAGVNVTKAGRRVPGLLVPQLRADGSTWGYQYRPDDPRLRDGKPVKYETPVGQRNGIDVPPGVAHHLGDPSVPLWVTEGVKKADAGALAGLCIIALPGVWSWRGGNAQGGKVAVPDWQDIALNDRRVILAFDGDVARKKSVRAALDALAAYLSSKGASVEFCHLPDEDDKVGLDDYLVAGGTVEQLRALVRPEPPAVVEIAPVVPVKVSDGSDGSGRSDGSGEHPLHRGIELSEGTREDGKALLDEVRGWLARHITVIDASDLDVLTLWAAHTHLSTALHSTPRLQLDSPVPESGKTTVLEHLERLCFRAVVASSISSPALLTRLVALEPRTLLLDEVDRTLDPKKEGIGDLMSILNSGYKVGSTRPTLVPVKDGGWQAEEMSTFAPVALAGNQPNLPDDTRSRIIRVLLYPDWTGRAEESDWELKDGYASELGARLARWSEHVRDQVRGRPEMPPGCTGRFREKWQPLARVAQAAGPEWLAIVMARAALDVAQVAADRDAGLAAEKPGVLLLRHIAQCWPQGQEFWGTADLVTTLVDLHPEAWGESSPYGKDLTAQRMGRMLVSNYGIRSTQEDRADKNSRRGYRRDQFAGATHALDRSAGSSGGSPTPVPEPSGPSEASEPSEITAPRALPGFTPPTGPGRCPICAHHVDTQGHGETCSERTAS